MEGFCFCCFGRVAVGLGHGFRVAEDGAGGAAQNPADGPCAVVVGKEDFADALLFGAIVPAAQQGEMVAQEGEIAGLACFFFECG